VSLITENVYRKLTYLKDREQFELGTLSNDIPTGYRICFLSTVLMPIRTGPLRHF
jgi:hypothetical protein